MKSIYIKILVLIFLPILSFGQSIQISSQNINQLIHSLAGAGVTVSNVTINGTPQNSYGYFTNGNPASVYKGIGLNEGLILTTGTTGNALGPNNISQAGFPNGTDGDPLLNTLINFPGSAQTLDANVISFDIVPHGNYIALDYVFASEEYNMYVDNLYNDVLGIFISGPGITGTKNIALVPGTTLPVCVNNINKGNGSSTDCSTLNGCTNCNYFETNCSGNVVQYNGFTKVLQAKATGLTPCKTYHMTFAISDVEDPYLDSALFIGKQSITSIPSGIQTIAFPTNCTACEKLVSPNNLSCRINRDGTSTLEWANMGGTSYVVEIVVNDPNCCTSHLPSYALPSVTTTTNSYTFSTSGYHCYSWRVKTVCAEGMESPFSNWICSKYCAVPLILNTFTISPNPSTSGIVRMSGTTVIDTKFTIEVYNTMGSKVKSFENKETVDKKFDLTWETGNLDRGIYYVNLIAEGGEAIQERLMIE